MKAVAIVLLLLSGCVVSNAATKGAYVPPIRVTVSNITYSVSTDQMWSRNQLSRSLITFNEKLHVRANGVLTEVRYTMLRGTVSSPRDFQQYLLMDLRGVKISPHTKYYIRPDIFKLAPNPALGVPKSKSTKSAPFVAPQLWLTWEQQRSVTLMWDRNPESNVVGYRVYRGRASRSYDTVVAVGNEISVLIPISEWGLKDYFAVTAYDSDGLESSYSAEVTYTSPSAAPWLVKLVRTQPADNPVGVFQIESKSDVGGAWTLFARRTNSFVAVTATGNKLFRVGKLP